MKTVLASSFLSCNWPKEQPINLGNLLVFRKEVELLLQKQQQEKALIYFDLKGEELQKIPYFEELFTTSFFCIEPKFESPNQSVWPIKEHKSWSYGSFKRLNFLVRNTNIFPEMLWKKSFLDKVKAHLKNLDFSKPVYAIHLKQSSSNIKESNADFEAWHKFFEKRKNIIFFLIGKDESPSFIQELPNVVLARALSLTLMEQLAMVQYFSGFLGMASGPCNVACLSRIPYVIFKHPEHHKLEMQKELGNFNYLPFALSKQQIRREIDSEKNLNKAFQFLCYKEEK